MFSPIELSEVKYMSYRIIYDSGIKKYEVKKITQNRKFVWLFLPIILLALAVPGSREAVRSVLIPGEDAVTVLAFRTMTDDLRSGAGMGEAFFDFCRMVMNVE